jgi:hypothetical protein
MTNDRPETPVSIEIDDETARLLERVASADGDAFDADLLTTVFSEREQFIQYLNNRGLSQDAAALSILKQIDSLRTEATE